MLFKQKQNQNIKLPPPDRRLWSLKIIAEGILNKNSGKLSGFWAECVNLKVKISVLPWNYPVGLRRLQGVLGELGASQMHAQSPATPTRLHDIIATWIKGLLSGFRRKRKRNRILCVGSPAPSGNYADAAQVVLWVCWHLALPDSCRSSVRNQRENFLCSHDWEPRIKSFAERKDIITLQISQVIYQGQLALGRKQDSWLSSPGWRENVFSWEADPWIFCSWE